MAAGDPKCRMGAHLLLVLALASLAWWSVVGVETVIPSRPPSTRCRGRRFKSTWQVIASRWLSRQTKPKPKAERRPTAKKSP